MSRWRPEHTYQEPELIAAFKPKKEGYFHSFSITENHVVLFIYPVAIEISKVWSVNFHLMELCQQDPKGVVDIYLINLKTGEVTTRQST